jgi:hypothetical protein
MRNNFFWKRLLEEKEKTTHRQSRRKTRDKKKIQPIPRYLPFPRIRASEKKNDFTPLASVEWLRSFLSVEHLQTSKNGFCIPRPLKKDQFWHCLITPSRLKSELMHLTSPLMEYHPRDSVSVKLNDTEKRYTVEMTAIVHGFRVWRHYLLGSMVRGKD